jgi:hypothetical protein
MVLEKGLVVRVLLKGDTLVCTCCVFFSLVFFLWPLPWKEQWEDQMTICKPGRAPLPPFPETRSVCTLILDFPLFRTKLWKRMFVAYATQMVFCYSSLGVANTIKESQEKQLGNSLIFFYITTDNLLLHHWKLLKLFPLWELRCCWCCCGW